MPASSPTPTALITGASAGIGAEFARVFAAHGFDLVLTARRADRLEALAAELRERHGRRVTVFAADLADPATPARLAADVAAAGIQIDALVNNAGYGLTGSFLATPWELHRDFIQVLVTAVADLTHRFLPGMIERQRGWIINVSSVAGFAPPSAGHTMYGAAKSLVTKFSQSLALEARPHGVYVTAVCPGFTYSEFHDVNGMRPQVSKFPGWVWLKAEDVAREAYEAVMRGDDVVINGWVYRVLVQLMRYTPQWLVRTLGRRVAGTYRKS